MVKSYDPTEKKVTAFGVESIKSNIKPIVKGNRLSFEVNVKSEGYLAENWNTKEKAFDDKFLEKSKNNRENGEKIDGGHYKK